MFDSGARSEQQRSTAPVDVDAIMLGFRDSSRLSSEALDACKVMMTAAQNLTEQELVAVVTSLLAHRAEAKRALRDLWAHKSAAPPDCDTAPPQSAARQSTPESTADSSHRGCCGDTIGAFKAMMTAPRHMTHQAGATVQLRNANGMERLLVFSQRPLNIKYKNELPIVVSFVGADGEGARQGVEVGDTLLACNGVTFQGKNASECHQFLQRAFESLPLCASVRLRSASGTERSLVFTQRPLNIQYKNELPMVVSTVADGEGARQGVEVGDTLLACNGVTFQGKDVSECHHLLQDAFNSLPYSRARATSISL